MEINKRRSCQLKFLNATTDRCVVFEVKNKPKTPKSAMKISVKQLNKGMEKIIKNNLSNLNSQTSVVH